MSCSTLWQTVTDSVVTAIILKCFFPNWFKNMEDEQQLIWGDWAGRHKSHLSLNILQLFSQKPSGAPWQHRELPPTKPQRRRGRRPACAPNFQFTHANKTNQRNLNSIKLMENQSISRSRSEPFSVWRSFACVQFCWKLHRRYLKVLKCWIFWATLTL